MAYSMEFFFFFWNDQTLFLCTISCYIQVEQREGCGWSLDAVILEFSFIWDIYCKVCTFENIPCCTKIPIDLNFPSLSLLTFAFSSLLSIALNASLSGTQLQLCDLKRFFDWNIVRIPFSRLSYLFPFDSLIAAWTMVFIFRWRVKCTYFRSIPQRCWL